jgi:oligopeptide/dipeptide ABC transporter ATP-binding protein
LHSNNLLLEVTHLKKYFPISKGILRRTVGHVRAVDDVDLFIREGETLGLVGESGSGKTTLGHSILRLLEPTAGDVWFHSREWVDKGRDLARINVVTASPQLLKLIRREMAIIFQDPYSSLDPRMTVGKIVAEPLEIHGISNLREREERAIELLNAVGLKADHVKRYPHEFSGGQRQRIGIARAIALHPQLIVADEPVSALDVSIQAQILNLLKTLQEQFHLTYLFIAHDLSVVRHISNRVTVMYLGKIVELAPSEELFNNPRHPYTEALMSAVPVPNPDYKVKRILLKGDVPSPAKPPPGCYFHPRCRYAKDICKAEAPLYRNIDSDHFVACHLTETLRLQPIRTAAETGIMPVDFPNEEP